MDAAMRVVVGEMRAEEVEGGEVGGQRPPAAADGTQNGQSRGRWRGGRGGGARREQVDIDVEIWEIDGEAGEKVREAGGD